MQLQGHGACIIRSAPITFARWEIPWATSALKFLIASWHVYPFIPRRASYLAAMAAAANYGRANRQLLTEATRRVFDQETSTAPDVLYDVSHNLATLETHPATARHTPCACTARERPARCHRIIPTYPPNWPRSASRC